MAANRKVMIFSMSVMLLLIALVTTETSNAVDIAEESNVYRLSQMPETQYFEQYTELSAPEKTVVVYPILTQTAYDWDGFHDLYAGYCDTCTVMKINEFYDPVFSVGAKSFRILEFLGYDVIDDLDIDKNPEILKQYNSVILLHNEFVTENEFLALTSHPNVIHLYPGSLNSKVSVNHFDNSVTLERGPAYPQSNVVNGFDWKYDNSDILTDTVCENWRFYKIDNGVMLNCTPEFLVQNSAELLMKLKQFSSR